MLGCLEALFEHAHEGVPLDEAVQALADMLAAHANQADFEIDADNTATLARRDLREWIRRSLIVEREGRLHETDALKSALRFVSQLDARVMTSTASRLAIVQREIEHLASHLNPDPHLRANYIQRQLDDLQQQMAAIQAGEVELLSDEQAIEHIRDIYSLAMSLRADFRRVEDSWRDADRQLRQSIISEHMHRGQVMDKLLDGHDSMLSTQEGRVFENFHQQLSNLTELTMMREQIRSIVRHPATDRALNSRQAMSLALLVHQLLREAKAVQAVRARSEREVGAFMKTGQAADSHRVGQLLNDILQQALQIDWQRQAVRRQPSPLPPINISLAGLPLIERLRAKSIDGQADAALLLASRHADMDEVEDEFWEAFDALDTQALVQQTLDILAQSKHPMTLRELAARLPPDHDLETLSLWLSMAREAGIALQTGQEDIDITHEPDQQRWRFTVPLVALDAARLAAIKWDV